MERSENLNSKSHILHSRQLKQLSIGINSFNFSKRITAKYSIFRKSANPPALIFLRLFSIRDVNKGGEGGLQFLASFVSRRLMNIQPGMILNTQKINKSASNVKINLSLFPESIDAAPNAFGAASISNYNASYVILDKRMLPDKQISTQTAQTTKNVIARSETPREIYPERDSSVTSFPQICPEPGDSSALPQNDKRRAWDNRLMVFSNQNHSVFLRKITDKYLQTASEDISTGIILNTQKVNNSALKIGTNIFSVTDYPEAGNNSTNVNYHRPERISAFFNDIPHYRLPKRSNLLIHKSEIDSLPLAMAKRNVAMLEKHIVNKSTELILRKPITQNTNTVSSKDYQHKEKIISPKMTENLTKDLKERSAHEINMIADKVYKIIEKKITIEKDRKGLR